MKKVSAKQAERIKKLAKIQPPKDGKCTRCHELPDFRGLHKHHIIPRARGGKDTKTNLEWLCAKCHGQKHGTEGMPKAEPVYDNTPEIFSRAGRPCPKPDPKKKEKK